MHRGSIAISNPVLAFIYDIVPVIYFLYNLVTSKNLGTVSTVHKCSCVPTGFQIKASSTIKVR